MTTSLLPRLCAALLCAGVAATALNTRAAETDNELDTRFRARLMKEKSKLNAEESNPLLKQRDVATGAAPLDATCGSQNIGNVNTGGQPGAAPREIFVFAPNAINIVGPRACGN